jgi:hypothetical protein
MMEEMQKMCKNMDKTNIPPFMDMKMQNNGMIEEMSKKGFQIFKILSSLYEFLYGEISIILKIWPVNLEKNRIS